LLTKFSGLPAELIEPAFAQILKRVDTSFAFTIKIATKKVDLARLGPAVSIVSEPIQTWRWPNEPTGHR